MTRQVRVSAPCKLNLHLEVGAVRCDGFHDLVSLFQLVSLADNLRIKVLPDPDMCRVVCASMDLPPVNTVTKAVDAFRAVTGVSAGVQIELDKCVPCGAGLGGGSSDAAAVLFALDILFETQLHRGQMLHCAASVGSDVPFFIDGGAAIVTGRGELVQPVECRTDLCFVIIWPEVFCSTGEAYRMVDARYTADSGVGVVLPSVKLAREYKKEPREWRFYNSFFIPIAEKFPAVAAAAAALKSVGAVYTALTGSGSAVFGVFSDAAQAESAVAELKRSWLYCYNVKPLSQYPVPVRESCE